MPECWVSTRKKKNTGEVSLHLPVRCLFIVLYCKVIFIDKIKILKTDVGDVINISHDKC
jgi:hypothetical protein